MIMATWTDYKKHVKETNPEIGADIEEMEALSKIVSTMVEQRHQLDISQRELAEMCGIPHSSVARIEAGRTTPNLNTLLKIFDKLQLRITVEPIQIAGKPI